MRNNFYNSLHFLKAAGENIFTSTAENLKNISAVIFCIIIFSSPEISEAADWRAESCSPGGEICQIYEQNGKVVDVYMQNRFPNDAIVTTVTLGYTAKPENIVSKAGIPLTMIIKGKSPVKAATFEIVDLSRRWNTNLNWYWQYGSAEKPATKFIYALPYEKGKRFRVGQAFNDTPTHHGAIAYSIDWVMPEGTPVCAAREGIVITTVSEFSEGGMKPEYLTKNNLVQILHDDGTVGQYVHMIKDGVPVKIGDAVKKGDVIAYSGNTGYSGGPHLHFSVFRPLDGKSSMSIPVGFNTVYSDYDILEKAAIYSHDDNPHKRKRLVVDDADVALCKAVENNQPVGSGESFGINDKVYLYVPFHLKRDGKIRIAIKKEGSDTAQFKSEWTIKKEWWYTFMDFDFSKISDSAGNWRAEVIINNNISVVKSFKMK